MATMTVAGACGLGPQPTPATSALAAPSGTSGSTASSTRKASSTAPTASPADIARQAAADAFAVQLDGLDPAERATVLDEFVSAIGSRLEGLSRPAAEAELLRMASVGTFRLDDPTLLRRLQLETKSILGLNTSPCGALARGELQSGGASPRMAALAAVLTPAERLESVRISVAAVRAEVAGQREPRPLTKPETAAILGAIAKLASPDEATRIHDLATTSTGGTALSDADACWLLRVPYRAMGRLGEADRLLLSRYVLGAMTG